MKAKTIPVASRLERWQAKGKGPTQMEGLTDPVTPSCKLNVTEVLSRSRT